MSAYMHSICPRLPESQNQKATFSVIAAGHLFLDLHALHQSYASLQLCLEAEDSRIEL